MTIANLIRDRVPHAPQMGLYVAPDLPAAKVRNARSDYAGDVERAEVLALYDATLSGTGSDGAVFAPDRFVFQNNDFQSVQSVRYRDLVGVEAGSRWFGLGGKKIDLQVNRGRATFDLTMDFSGAPDAAEYVADFLHAAMLKDVDVGPTDGASSAETDVAAVRQALDRLPGPGEARGNGLRPAARRSGPLRVNSIHQIWVGGVAPSRFPASNEIDDREHTGRWLVSLEQIPEKDSLAIRHGRSGENGSEGFSSRSVLRRGVLARPAAGGPIGCPRTDPPGIPRMDR